MFKRIYITAILLTGFCLSAEAQFFSKPKNNPKYDKRRVHFGFSVGLNYVDFKVEHIENLASLPGYYSVKTETTPGYTFAIVSNLRLSEYLDLRFLPAYSTTIRKMHFDVIEPLTDKRQIVDREIESSYIEFPFHLKWKSERINNYRIYTLGGIKYNLDLASNEDVIDDRIFKIKSNDMMYELGFGFDVYFDYFKFSPQIIASFGINNLLVQDGTFYVEGIETLKTRAILINFTFE